MAGSNLISALNAQRAPHGGVMTTGRHKDCPVEKKLLPALPFKYDSSFSASHGGFCRIDLHWWFLCFPLCLAQCDLWLIQAHTKTKGARLQMRYRFFLRMCRERRTDHRCFTVLPSVFVCFFLLLSARGLLTTVGDLRRDYRMRGSIPTLWQASWPTVINLSRWQPRGLWDS